MEIPITEAQPIKVGNSHYFTIPAQYINNGAIQKGKKYNLLVSELKEKLKKA